MIRRWLEKQSDIEQLLEAIRLELRRGTLAATRVPIQQLAARVQGHLATEVDLYFPRLECVSPFSAELLESLRSSHCELRQGVEDLRELSETGDTISARRAFAVVLHRLYRYEVEEVDLMAALNGLARRAWPMEPRLH